MTISPKRCPLCGQPNECQLAMQTDFKGPCWCMRENFPPKLLARVPEEARHRACICQRCVAEAQRAFFVPGEKTNTRPSAKEGPGVVKGPE